LAVRGLPKDELLGIVFIRKAAEQKYQGALEFLADASETGTYGLPKDADQAAYWRGRLQDKDVVHYWDF